MRLKRWEKPRDKKSESVILKECIVKLYDTYGKQALIVRHNTGSCKRGNSYIQFHSGGKGFPDIICYFSFCPIFIEVKSEKGKLSKEQKEFEKKCQERNIPYIVVRSAEEALAKTKQILESGGNYGKVSSIHELAKSDSPAESSREV